MDERLTLIAAANDGLVLLRTARAAGIPVGVVRWAARTGRLVPIAPGAHAERTQWDGSTRAQRHVLALRASLARSPGSVASGLSAAVLWQLPLPGPPPPRPVVCAPRTSERPQHGGNTHSATTRRAWLAPDEITTLRGVRVTTPERTFVDCARHLDLPWSLAVADAVRREQQVSRAQLIAAADRCPSAPGHARAIVAAAHSEHLVESPLESLARGVQIRLGLAVPRVQAWIGDSRPEFRVDMLVVEYATVVEADGRLKYDGVDGSPDRRWEDKRRQDRLLDLGYDCHRFVAADAHRPVAWARDLLRTFARSHRRRGLPVPHFAYPWA